MGAQSLVRYIHSVRTYHTFLAGGCGAAFTCFSVSAPGFFLESSHMTRDFVEMLAKEVDRAIQHE